MLKEFNHSDIIYLYDRFSYPDVRQITVNGIRFHAIADVIEENQEYFGYQIDKSYLISKIKERSLTDQMVLVRYHKRFLYSNAVGLLKLALKINLDLVNPAELESINALIDSYNPTIYPSVMTDNTATVYANNPEFGDSILSEVTKIFEELERTCGKKRNNYSYVQAGKFITAIEPNLSSKRLGCCYNNIKYPDLISIGRLNYLTLLGCQIAYISYMVHHNVDMLVKYLLADKSEQHKKSYEYSLVNKGIKFYPHNVNDVYYLDGEMHNVEPLAKGIVLASDDDRVIDVG